MAEDITINQVRTNQIVITIEYNNAGLATGAALSAHGTKLDSAGTARFSIEKSWQYAGLPAQFKSDIRGLVQAATKAMSAEIGETDEVVLG